VDDEGPEPEAGGPLAADDGHGRGKGQHLLTPILPFARQDLRLRKLPMGLVEPLLSPSTSTESRIKQRRRRRSRGGCDDRRLLGELDVDISEGAEHGCSGVKHGGHGLLEGLGAFSAGDALWVWRMVVVVPVVVVAVRGGERGRTMSSMSRSKMADEKE
jgi:hypothetical protein